MNRTAADYMHPAASFAYYAAVILIAMLFFHPVFIAVGLVFATAQALVYTGARALLKQLVWSLPFCIVVALFNPLVSHGGKTLLFYLWGSPVTLEALFYGICSGGMLLLVFIWFGVYNRIVTPEKFMILFARLAPAAAMLVTMTQRMFPLFARRLEEIRAAQKTLRAMPQSGGKLQTARARFNAGLAEISILLGWSMEEGLDTADSMKARGYGMRRRTTFSVYRFTMRDGLALLLCLVTAGVCAAFYYGSAHVRFYPRVAVTAGGTGFYTAIAAYCLLAALPLINEARYALVFYTANRRATKNTEEMKYDFG